MFGALSHQFLLLYVLDDFPDEHEGDAFEDFPVFAQIFPLDVLQAESHIAQLLLAFVRVGGADEE
jgi:hypothetical protein